MNTEDNIKLSKSNFISSKTTPIFKGVHPREDSRLRCLRHRSTCRSIGHKADACGESFKKIRTGHEPPSKRSRNPITTEPP